MQEILGVVLAGGRSSRMGEDKAKLAAGSGTLLSHAIALLQPYCQKVWVNGNYPEFDSILDEPSDAPFQGPLAGLKACFNVLLERGAAGILVLPVDMPSIGSTPLEMIVRTVHAQPEQAAAFQNSLFPLYLPLNQQCLVIIEQLMSSEHKRERSIRALLDKLGANMLSYSKPNAFTNINTPEQYLAYRNQ